MGGRVEVLEPSQLRSDPLGRVVENFPEGHIAIPLLQEYALPRLTRADRRLQVESRCMISCFGAGRIIK